MTNSLSENSENCYCAQPIHNGDVIPDPDMELIVDFHHQTVNAKSYQNLYVYSVVEEDDKKLQQELNEFLDMWLDNLIEQGHKWECVLFGAYNPPMRVGFQKVLSHPFEIAAFI